MQKGSFAVDASPTTRPGAAGALSAIGVGLRLPDQRNQIRDGGFQVHVLPVPVARSLISIPPLVRPCRAHRPTMLNCEGPVA